MALDREIERIEQDNKEYKITPYTIQYDSKAQSFFKGFTPKLATSGTLTALGAGACIASVLTGGIAGIAIGAVAGVVAGGYTIWTGVDAAHVSKARFKALGIGGKKENAGTIEVVKHSEEMAHKFTKLLEEYPDEKTFELEDGATYTRRDLQKRIKGYEREAYNGLNYILKQGLYVSDKIETLGKRKNLTPYEENLKKQYWDIMDRVSACVKSVASNRLYYNPYKGLIIDAMQKGCLLGDYHQINKIREAKAIGDKDNTIQLYFEMYERDLLESNSKKRPEQKPIDRREHEQLKRDKVKLEQDIESLKEEISKISQKSARRVQTAWNIRGQKKVLQKRTEELEDIIEELYQRLDEYEKKLAETKAKLGETQEKLEETDAKRKKALQEVFVVGQQHGRAVKTAWKHRGESRYWRGRAEDAEKTVGALYDGYTENEEISKGIIVGMIKDNAKRNNAHKKAMANSTAEAQRLFEENERLVRTNELAGLFLDEEMDRNDQLSQDLADKTSKLTSAKKQSKKDKATIEKMAGQLEDAYAGWYETEQEARNSYSSAKQLEEHNTELTAQNQRQKTKIGAQAKKIGAQGTQIKTQNKTIETQSKKIEELNADIDALVQGQTENIFTIAGLEGENERLVEERSAWQKIYEATAETAAELGWDLYKTRRELGEMTDERDAFELSTNELLGELNTTKIKLDEAEEELNNIQTKKEVSFFNMQWSGARKRLERILNKAEAHVDLTIEERSVVDETCKAVLGFIQVVREQDLETKTTEELNELNSTFKAIYNATKKGLVKISKADKDKLDSAVKMVQYRITHQTVVTQTTIEVTSK